MVNIPSVTKTQEMAVGHYDKDELETYIQAVICKIEKKDYFLQELNTKKLLIILFIMIIIMIVVVG